MNENSETREDVLKFCIMRAKNCSQVVRYDLEVSSAHRADEERWEVDDVLFVVQLELKLYHILHHNALLTRYKKRAKVKMSKNEDVKKSGRS